MNDLSADKLRPSENGTAELALLLVLQKDKIDSEPIVYPNTYSGDQNPIYVGLRESKSSYILGLFEMVADKEVVKCDPVGFFILNKNPLSNSGIAPDQNTLYVDTSDTFKFDLHRGEPVGNDRYFSPIFRNGKWDYGYAFSTDYGKTKLERRAVAIDRILSSAELNDEERKILEEMKKLPKGWSPEAIATFRRFSSSIHKGVGLGKKTIVLALEVARQLGKKEVIIDMCNTSTQNVIESLKKDNIIKTCRSVETDSTDKRYYIELNPYLKDQ